MGREGEREEGTWTQGKIKQVTFIMTTIIGLLSSRTDVCNPKKHRFSLENPLPVRIDWSTRRVVDFMEVILMSAGTLSPTVGWEKKKRESVSLSDL